MGPIFIEWSYDTSYYQATSYIFDHTGFLNKEYGVHENFECEIPLEDFNKLINRSMTLPVSDPEVIKKITVAGFATVKPCYFNYFKYVTSTKTFIFGEKEIINQLRFKNQMKETLDGK